MIKLYRFTDGGCQYWETWDNEDGTFTVHWGELGFEGDTKLLSGSGPNSAEILAEAEANQKLAEGYDEPETVYGLEISYKVDGFGTQDDLDKRHRLEEQLNETLGWTGLGHCDGGSIGSDSMEVYCLVVDFPLARSVIEQDLKDTEFGDYLSITEPD